MLEDVLWHMENVINFHNEEEYREGFPSLRTALAEARVLTQALVPPSAVYTIPLESIPKWPESLVIQVRSGTEGRTVTTVHRCK